MLILAFDTTSEHGGVSLHRELERLASIESHREANYSVTLFQMVDHLLAETKLALQDLDLIAVATGPGSFTGIRVGLAAAQGWAQAIGRPVWGVSVLEAMAEEARPVADWAVPILDARRGEFYLSTIRRVDAEGARGGVDVASHARPWGSVQVQDTQEADASQVGVGPPGVLLGRDSVRPFLERFANRRSPGESVCFVACEWDGASQSLRAALDPESNWRVVGGPLTGAIARLALIAHREGRALTPNQLDALYLRRSDAEMHWKED